MDGVETVAQMVRFIVNITTAIYNNFVHHADVDECGEGVCTNCTNLMGSFQCTCPDGNTLSPGLTCVGEL